MIPVVRTDILKVLNESRRIIEQKNSFLLKELSNHTIHNASIFQDEDSVSIAIIIYSLSKLMERSTLDMHPAARLVSEAERELERENLSEYIQKIKQLFSFIAKCDTKLKLYIEQVIMQAQIRKGSKLYDHGISLAQASEVLGISEWELMGYVGKTTIADEFKESVDVKKRLALARKLFSIRER